MRKVNAIGLILLTIGAAWMGISFRKNTTEVNLSSNEYKVLTVQGRIVFEQTGKDMERGDLYVTGTPLNFISATSRAAIINEINGRYVLSSSKGKLKVLPAANNVSSRNGALLNLIDLKQHFADRYLVIGVSKIQMNAGSFPMNDSCFFYLSFDHNGETINKKLIYENDQLILDPSQIFKVDGQPIEVSEKDMTLYYKGDKNYKINTFTPVFVAEEDLKTEVSIILETLKGKEKSHIVSEVESYLFEFYGNPAHENLTTWLQKEFGIE